MRIALMAVLCGLSLLMPDTASVLARRHNNASEGASAQPAGHRAQRPDIYPIRQDGFEVEVLIDGMPQEKYAARGRYYVEARKGAEYALRIRNPLPSRIAVALSVDGLNTIDARRTNARAASKWVLEPYQEITIDGWQMSSTRARRFYFTNEPDAYATKLGRATDIGVISAVFFRERQNASVITPPRPLEESRHANKREAEAPSAAPATNAGQANDRAIAPAPDDEYAATGIGRSVNRDVYRVNLDLESRPAAEVSLRYEYHGALVRLGVLPRPDTEPDPLRRRERARGFADRQFCPEP